MTEVVPTRQRLLTEGMRLFAERGFEATAVGDIEAAAGLQPRRGALYKHFPSKHALLVAAVRGYLDRAGADAARLVELDVTGAATRDRDERRHALIGLGQWFLDEMDRLRDLTHVIEHDRGRMGELVEELKASMVDLSYRTATRLIVAVAPELDDPEATAVVVLGSLVALRRTAWTFGSPPLDIDDPRALTAWADMALATLTQGSDADCDPA
jgi:AcrR family transcriptional regulator